MSLNILCLETSHSVCSVALTTGHGLHSRQGEGRLNHAESINRLIQECMAEAGLAFNDLHAVALSDGPGSYTGLRIGASTAKGICFAVGIPLIAVSTLTALATEAKRRNAAFKGYFWPMVDARRMEVYHALYDSQLNRLSEPVSAVITEPGFRPELAGPETLLCGDGAAKAADILGLTDLQIIPHAEFLAGPAAEYHSAGKFADIDSYQPGYIKQANITLPSKGKQLLL